MADIDPATNRCEGMLIHTSSGGCIDTLDCEVRLTHPARLIVTIVPPGTSVSSYGDVGNGVMIWADDSDALEAWISVADRSVQSLRFDQP